MDDTLQSKILELLDHHRIMTVATNRPDGWPPNRITKPANAAANGTTIFILAHNPRVQASNMTLG
jgi:hypothetical protein